MFSDACSGLRLTLETPAKKSVLADLCWTISEMRGSIVSLGSFNGGVNDGRGLVVVKVRDVRRDQLLSAIENLGDHVLDVREV